MANLIWKTLKTNLSKGQIIGYAVANTVGLAVILCGLLFFADSRHNLDQHDDFFTKDYVVISKPISPLSFEAPQFDADDIADIRRQPWAGRVGRFTSSQFRVKISVDIASRGFSSYLFLESVPDEFFDNKPAEFRFDPARPIVPIILSKEYLALYNYGFAMPQGLPKASEQLVEAIPLTLTAIAADGHSEDFAAKIVGFSSRLNTIAVPEQFMLWANNRFAPGVNPPVSRLIVETDPMESNAMTTYFEEANIEIGGNHTTAGKVADLLGIASTVVAAIGLIISALAIFILILSIYLLLQKSKEKLRNLILLGYSPNQIGSYYIWFILVINLIVTILALSIAFGARALWAPILAELSLGGSSPVLPLVTSAIYLLFITAVNSFIIVRRIRL